MPVAKKTEHVSAVHVETKKMTDECCSMKKPCMHKCLGHLIVVVLLVINIILSICALNSSSRIEAMKVGGKDNYNLVQKIYESKTFQSQQKQQIEQALQMYQGGGTAATAQPQVQAQAQAQAQPQVQVQPQTK